MQHSYASDGRIVPGRDARPARLLVVETVLPDRARDRPAAIRMDLIMLMLLGGRERTRDDFERLLTEAGFTRRGWFGPARFRAR